MSLKRNLPLNTPSYLLKNNNNNSSSPAVKTSYGLSALFRNIEKSHESDYEFHSYDQTSEVAPTRETNSEFDPLFYITSFSLLDNLDSLVTKDVTATSVCFNLGTGDVTFFFEESDFDEEVVREQLKIETGNNQFKRPKLEEEDENSDSESSSDSESDSDKEVDEYAFTYKYKLKFSYIDEKGVTQTLSSKVLLLL